MLCTLKSERVKSDQRNMMTFDKNNIVNAETLIDVEAKNAKDAR